MRNAEVRAKLEELMIAVEMLHEETGKQRTDDHNENVRNMMMAGNVEKRLGALEESAKNKERRLSELESRLAGTREHIIMELQKESDRVYENVNKECAETRRQMAELITIQEGRYNEILAEMNEVKKRMACLMGIHGEVKDMISATNRLIEELSEAKADEGNAHIADMKAVIAERLARNEKTPLSTVELAELAEAAKKVAEAEEMTERRKTQRCVRGTSVF